MLRFGFDYHVLIEEMPRCLLALEYEIEIIKLCSMYYYLILALDYAMILL